jgi:hypothetical protein
MDQIPKAQISNRKQDFFYPLLLGSSICNHARAIRGDAAPHALHKSVSCNLVMAHGARWREESIGTWLGKKVSPRKLTMPWRLARPPLSVGLRVEKLGTWQYHVELSTTSNRRPLLNLQSKQISRNACRQLQRRQCLSKDSLLLDSWHIV